MNGKMSRLMQVIILIGMGCSTLFLGQEKMMDAMAEEMVSLVMKEKMIQEKSDYTKMMEEKEGISVQEKIIDLPEMEWGLFISTEFSWGASGSKAKRYAIYGDFIKTKKQGEDTYFALCEKILGRKLEQADYTDWEEANRGYEYQMEWVEIMDEHIVDCSSDLNQIISWKRNDFLSEYGDMIWYENGERMLESKESYIYGRNLILNKIDTKNTLIEFRTVIEEVLQENFELYYDIYWSRPVWEIDTSGEVMAVVNGKEGEADGIYVYSVNSSKNLMYELPIPIDEAKWPIQVSQIKGDIHGGWVIYTYGYETFRMKYPSGEREKLGEYMFSASYSPDENYLAYCTGNEAMWDSWIIWAGVDESMIKNYVEPMKEEWEKIPQGWYVIDLETGEKSYIPVPYWKYDADRPLYGGRCTWIEKDKLMELLEME